MFIDYAFRNLNDEIKRCHQCRLAETRINALCGEGNLHADLMLIAQAPGEHENREGRMFIGPSGKVLDELLATVDIQRGDIYMTNLVKCVLPRNRKPKSNEIASCGPYLDKGVLYLLGPGTTLKAVADELGVPKTLLGIDAVLDGNLVGTDLNEKGILELMDTYEKRKILLTPIGGNGFILGRGSKQFTPEVIKRIGRENIMVVGTRDKISRLECLRVDTGDFEVDQLLSGYLQVTVGYKEEMMVEVRC